MKLVIDKIVTPPDNCDRTIVNLDNVSKLRLVSFAKNEQLLITLNDGSLDIYEIDKCQFGLLDGHGGVACASAAEVMNAYLESKQ